MAQKLEGNDLMPNGKYKGTKLDNVPAQYLLYCYHNDWLVPSVKRYVKENYLAIQKEFDDEENKKTNS